MARAGLTYDKIVLAAAELVEENGYRKLSLHALAARLGVKAASLYNHVNGLEELISALNQLALTRLDHQLKAAIEGKEKAEALMAFALSYRTYAKENPELYKAIIRLPSWEDNEIKESGYQVIQVIYEILQGYPLTEAEIIHFGRGLRSAMHGFVSLEQAGFFKMDLDVEESYARLIKGYLSLLGGMLDGE